MHIIAFIRTAGLGYRLMVQFISNIMEVIPLRYQRIKPF